MQHRFQKLLAKWGKLLLKFTCPASISICYPPLFNKDELLCGDSAEKTLFAERGKLGSCSACPIAVFCRIHLQLAMGQVVKLHAGLGST